MTTIYIDGTAYRVDPAQNLLHVALSQGLDLPYFCWHPAMGSVGACRQCAVKQFKDEQDTSGRLVMACMTPAAEGTRIAIEDPEAVEFRASVIEWLMVNHPHDCPVCDEGGECHLQDMTLMTGHNYRRYRFQKRTYRNQYLGPFLHHEMNRCIQCYRCVRFYREYAGGRDLDVFGAHDQVYFGRHSDGVLENEFSGNLVEVCPTGVFTDKTLHHHYTRKWDLQTAPSVCVNCSVGCNTIPGERYGELRRILNRYNREVNGYFICDRGRYGYEFVNSPLRIREPHRREPGNASAVPVMPETAINQLGDRIRNGAKVIGIGSPRASLEANYALRTLVGPERFYSGMSAGESRLVSAALEILQRGPVRSASLHDVELSDAVFILGEDLTNTAPMLAYAVRQSVRNQPMRLSRQLGIPDWNDAAVREAVQDARGPLFLAAPARTKLDELATIAYQAAPDDLARLGFAVAHVLDPSAPAVAVLSSEMLEQAQAIAQSLLAAERPVIIAGASLGSLATLQAAANVAWALHSQGRPVQLSLVVPECNSLGAGMIGGGDLEAARKALESGEADTLIVLENDLYRRAAPGFVDSLLDAVQFVIAIDHVDTPTSSRSNLALPAAVFAEGDGTLVNNEGRAQRFFQVFVPSGAIQESWRWLRDVMIAAGRLGAAAWLNLDAITAEMVTALPMFAPVPQIAPPENYRIAGQKIPRQPHRYSGRTAMFADVTVHEPEPPEDRDAPFNFSMEGFDGRPVGPLIPRYWAPGWNSAQAVNKFQSEIAGPLVGGDPGVRLIEPAPAGGAAYLGPAPAAFQPADGEWLLVPFYHIFGSEELSRLSAPIVELAPEPYIAISPADAERLQVSPDSGQSHAAFPGSALPGGRGPHYVSQGDGVQGSGPLPGDPRDDAIQEVLGDGKSLPGESPAPAPEDYVSLALDDETYTLLARVDPGLPPGVAGLPSGLPGLQAAAVKLPASARLAPAARPSTEQERTGRV